MAATYQVPAPKSQEGTVLLPVGPTPLLSPHLQVLQSLVCDGRVREAAGPEWSEVGRVKLVVLLLVLKVVVEPSALVLVPQEGRQGRYALCPQISVLRSLGFIPWAALPLDGVPRAVPRGLCPGQLYSASSRG